MCKVKTFMGLWQFAQASSVLNLPIQSVFPEGGDPIMRMDFHRVFFPVNYIPESNADNIRIMWTSVQRNCVPNHFVPLLPKKPKYANIHVIGIAFCACFITFCLFQL